MRSFGFVIVEVDSDYNNEIKISEGVNLVVNSTIESVEHINRIARVVSSPDFTLLKEGDEVVIHHNICRLRNGIKGETVKSNYHIEDNKYFVPFTEIFMYKRGEDDWKAIFPYCFVEPIKAKNNEINKETNLEIIDTSDTHKGYEKNVGILKYSNEWLDSYGFVSGDKISFSDDSEYEFKIDGKLYYKMSVNDVLGKIE